MFFTRHSFYSTVVNSCFSPVSHISRSPWHTVPYLKDSLEVKHTLLPSHQSYLYIKGLPPPVYTIVFEVPVIDSRQPNGWIKFACRCGWSTTKIHSENHIQSNVKICQKNCKKEDVKYVVCHISHLGRE